VFIVNCAKLKKCETIAVLDQKDDIILTMGKVQAHKRAEKAKRQVDFRLDKKKNPDLFDFEGVIDDCLPNTSFRLTVTKSEIEHLVNKQLLGTLAGKMRLYRIRVLPGDSVKGYVSKYDLTRAKITYRSIKSSTQ
jgi:translation initiation factor IF-1